MNDVLKWVIVLSASFGFFCIGYFIGYVIDLVKRIENALCWREKYYRKVKP